MTEIARIPRSSTRAATAALTCGAWLQTAVEQTDARRPDSADTTALGGARRED